MAQESTVNARKRIQDLTVPDAGVRDDPGTPKPTGVRGARTATGDVGLRSLISDLRRTSQSLGGIARGAEVLSGKQRDAREKDNETGRDLTKRGAMTLEQAKMAEMLEDTKAMEAAGYPAGLNPHVVQGVMEQHGAADSVGFMEAARRGLRDLAANNPEATVDDAQALIDSSYESGAGDNPSPNYITGVYENINQQRQLLLGEFFNRQEESNRARAEDAFGGSVSTRFREVLNGASPSIAATMLQDDLIIARGLGLSEERIDESMFQSALEVVTDLTSEGELLVAEDYFIPSAKTGQLSPFINNPKQVRLLRSAIEQRREQIETETFNDIRFAEAERGRDLNELRADLRVKARAGKDVRRDKEAERYLLLGGSQEQLTAMVQAHHFDLNWVGGDPQKGRELIHDARTGQVDAAQLVSASAKDLDVSQADLTTAVNAATDRQDPTAIVNDPTVSGLRSRLTNEMGIIVEKNSRTGDPIMRAPGRADVDPRFNAAMTEVFVGMDESIRLWAQDNPGVRDRDPAAFAAALKVIAGDTRTQMLGIINGLKAQDADKARLRANAGQQAKFLSTPPPYVSHAIRSRIELADSNGLAVIRGELEAAQEYHATIVGQAADFFDSDTSSATRRDRARTRMDHFRRENPDTFPEGADRFLESEVAPLSTQELQSSLGLVERAEAFSGLESIEEIEGVLQGFNDTLERADSNLRKSQRFLDITRDIRFLDSKREALIVRDRHEIGLFPGTSNEVMGAEFFSQLGATELMEGARVRRVLDGDTVDVFGPDGAQERIRMQTIDAPESAQFGGHEAQQDLAKRLRGQTVKIFHKPEKDPFGRILGNFVIDGELTPVGVSMVRAGLAPLYRDRMNKVQVESYLPHEQFAKDNKLGIWADGRASHETPSQFRARNR